MLHFPPYSIDVQIPLMFSALSTIGRIDLTRIDLRCMISKERKNLTLHCLNEISLL